MIGKYLIKSHRENKSIVKILSDTKTMWKLEDGTRLRKSDLGIVGDRYSFFSPYFYKAKEGEIEQLTNNLKLERILYDIRRWTKVEATEDMINLASELVRLKKEQENQP